jgi:hypothetical protein
VAEKAVIFSMCAALFTVFCVIVILKYLAIVAAKLSVSMPLAVFDETTVVHVEPSLDTAIE